MYSLVIGLVYEFVHLNPQKAIWLREQKTITDDDYIHFYVFFFYCIYI
jgi:HSP90 family molecular chaperone